MESNRYGADSPRAITVKMTNDSAVDFAYDPDAPTPVQWIEFLDQLWPDDGESIAKLARRVLDTRGVIPDAESVEHL